MRKFLLILYFFQSCIGAGDMFAKSEKVAGNYYLVETENGANAIGYKGEDGYNIRSPEGVVAYAVKDSILVMKIRVPEKDSFYCVININKEEMARKEDYLIDSLPASNFRYSWLAPLRLDFQAVK